MRKFSLYFQVMEEYEITVDAETEQEAIDAAKAHYDKTETFQLIDIEELETGGNTRMPTDTLLNV